MKRLENGKRWIVRNEQLGFNWDLCMNTWWSIGGLAMKNGTWSLKMSKVSHQGGLTMDTGGFSEKVGV